MMLPYNCMPPLGWPMPPHMPMIPDDIDIINYAPVGPPGPPGPPGPSGSCCHQMPVKLVSNDYYLELKDVYIGTDNTKSINIVLPENPEQGKYYIIKLEIGAPVGNRKVKILPPGTATIDGQNYITLQNPYESVRLIYHQTNWFLI